MRDKTSRVELLRALRDREQQGQQGWVLSSDLPPGLQQAAEAAARQGLVRLADREMRAELSAYEGRPVLWAARLTAEAHDALAYAEASPAPAPRSQPAEGERLIELRPVEMDAVRVYLSIRRELRVPPADGLAERVRTAFYDRPNNRWTMCLTPEQIESVAYALHLRSISGSITEANRFARAYGVAVRVDDSTGRLQPTHLR
ncbi:DUF6417 family protein [Streptomyces sp. NPDC001792]|uniref:DUF6417 family protein n=1 Tax=unclassified Streptomyces TaxID=2593676 RepID=UPI00332BDB94